MMAQRASALCNTRDSTPLILFPSVHGDTVQAARQPTVPRYESAIFLVTV